ncbi:hypothetical protein AAFF_G00351930 [Aldrovandia affinis]|uniref:E3 ubiquitin-protein ligase ZSWIM2 n=1 Tax=Aldrovandia affinis TaxID=143900 RepID=A0AAD7WNC7_9TELE|nr:hypothetical protein AAFF_G00351930 [Aldrovandia affinis]
MPASEVEHVSTRPDAFVMFQKIYKRHSVSDALHLHQNQALTTTIFILKECGPTGFVLKEEGESKEFKVCLGNPHTCTCLTFAKEKDLCKHICWVLIRRFRLPRNHEYCLQLGLVDRQINDMVQDLHPLRTARPVNTPAPPMFEEDGCVRQKEIDAEDVCPICQEELLGKRLPVAYCRYGCGNNIHISCMKVWADHQSPLEADDMVQCPLCREGFEPMNMLLDQVKNAASLLTTSERERSDKHLGILCNNCRIYPITGKCYKCITCSYYFLCDSCYNRHSHPHHPFAYRAKRKHRWVSLRMSGGHHPESAKTEANCAVRSDTVPEHIVRGLLPVEVAQGSKLLKPGQQCRLCLKSFNLGQGVKVLICHHKFHADCADKWLLQSNTCPLDGYVIYNPLTWQRSGNQIATKPGKIAPPFGARASPKQKLERDLFVPGLRLQCSKPACSTLVPRQKDFAENRIHGLRIANEPAWRCRCTRERSLPQEGPGLSIDLLNLL